MQKKKDINGSEYASMIEILSRAVDGGFATAYSQRLIEQIINMFLEGHKDSYYSTGDQIKLLKGFDNATK